MAFTYTFLDLFFLLISLLMPILLMMCIIIIIMGQLAGRLEQWKVFDALYWTFITALTVGYGDMRPLSRLSKILSILIAMFGIMFTGVIVAVTVNTATVTIEHQLDPEEIDALEEMFKD